MTVFSGILGFFGYQIKADLGVLGDEAAALSETLDSLRKGQDALSESIHQEFADSLASYTKRRNTETVNVLEQTGYIRSLQAELLKSILVAEFSSQQAIGATQEAGTVGEELVETASELEKEMRMSLDRVDDNIKVFKMELDDQFKLLRDSLNEQIILLEDYVKKQKMCETRFVESKKVIYSPLLDIRLRIDRIRGDDDYIDDITIGKGKEELRDANFGRLNPQGRPGSIHMDMDDFLITLQVVDLIDIPDKLVRYDYVVVRLCKEVY